MPIFRYIWVTQDCPKMDLLGIMYRSNRKTSVKKSPTSSVKIGSFSYDNSQQLPLVDIHYFKVQNVLHKI